MHKSQSTLAFVSVCLLRVVDPIPVVFQDLRPAESIFQVVDALENLETVVDKVFNAISDRVNSETSRITDIRNRLCVAEVQEGLVVFNLIKLSWRLLTS